MATLVEKVRVYRGGIRYSPVTLLPIPFDRAGPQHIIPLGPPNGDGVLRAPPILITKLSYGASYLLRCHHVLII